MKGCEVPEGYGWMSVCPKCGCDELLVDDLFDWEASLAAGFGEHLEVWCTRCEHSDPLEQWRQRPWRDDTTGDLFSGTDPPTSGSDK